MGTWAHFTLYSPQVACILSEPHLPPRPDEDVCAIPPVFLRCDYGTSLLEFSLIPAVSFAQEMLYLSGIVSDTVPDVIEVRMLLQLRLITFPLHCALEPRIAQRAYTRKLPIGTAFSVIVSFPFLELKVKQISFQHKFLQI